MAKLYLSKKNFCNFMIKTFEYLSIGSQLGLDDICHREVAFNCCLRHC
jgi:hypothetical protein